MSKVSQVIRDFYSFKIGPEVLLAAREKFEVNLRHTVDSPTWVCYYCYTDIFSSVSNVSQVIRDCYSFKIGPDVIFATKWRPKAKMMSPFDSPTLILYRLSVETFRLCLTVHKLFVCIYLAGNLAFRFQNLGFRGIDSKM
jgi:hypothetical protein